MASYPAAFEKGFGAARHGYLWRASTCAGKGAAAEELAERPCRFEDFRAPTELCCRERSVRRLWSSGIARPRHAKSRAGQTAHGYDEHMVECYFVVSWGYDLLPGAFVIMIDSPTPQQYGSMAGGRASWELGLQLMVRLGQHLAGGDVVILRTIP